MSITAQGTQEYDLQAHETNQSSGVFNHAEVAGFNGQIGLYETRANEDMSWGSYAMDESSYSLTIHFRGQDRAVDMTMDIIEHIIGVNAEWVDLQAYFYNGEIDIGRLRQDIEIVLNDIQEADEQRQYINENVAVQQAHGGANQVANIVFPGFGEEDIQYW